MLVAGYELEIMLTFHTETIGISSKEVWQYNANKKWYNETRIAMTDVSDYNFFALVLLTMHLLIEQLYQQIVLQVFLNIRSYNFNSVFIEKNIQLLYTFDMLDSAGGIIYAMCRLDYPNSRCNGHFNMPTNSVTLGLLIPGSRYRTESNS